MKEERKTTKQGREYQNIKSAVIQALSRIEHPEIKNQNIVDLGMVPEIRVEDRLVTITLAFPFQEVPITAELPQRVIKAANGACPGMQVKVDVKK
ncbi:MAG: hypothetical protein A2Z14_16770 [Chloroflexi bacterium RBG_16_48_8]|nr:MAG: hypothetical protein A2Z14_16770 [Chloroflexi bacterium RBG_16_48_8]